MWVNISYETELSCFYQRFSGALYFLGISQSMRTDFALAF